MVIEKAQTAKDKGNLAFKAGDYSTAIGHYTTAILADRNDPTYPLNRAAAYLKLGKNEDAVRDCTTVLELSKNNIKGLFRRGQARVALGKYLDARKDFSDVLLVEPSNAAAQDEMKKLAPLIYLDKVKNSKTSASLVQASLESAATTVRRRVPIKILDASGKVVQASATTETSPSGTSNSKQSPSSPPTTLDVKKPLDTLEAVSSRLLKSSEAVPSTQDLPTRTQSTSSKPNSFTEAKVARESARPSRVGGGVFRASGESTIFAANDHGLRDDGGPQPSAFSQFSDPLQPAKAPPKETEMTFEAPSTLFDFNRTWSLLSSPEERWRYLNTVEPSTLPKLCQTLLEPSLLVSVLETFLAILSSTNDLSENQRRVLAYLESFANVPRFGTLLLFLSRKEKQLAKQVWALLGLVQPNGVWRSVA